MSVSQEEMERRFAELGAAPQPTAAPTTPAPLDPSWDKARQELLAIQAPHPVVNQAEGPVLSDAQMSVLSVGFGQADQVPKAASWWDTVTEGTIPAAKAGFKRIIPGYSLMAEEVATSRGALIKNATRADIQLARDLASARGTPDSPDAWLEDLQAIMDKKQVATAQAEAATVLDADPEVQAKRAKLAAIRKEREAAVPGQSTWGQRVYLGVIESLATSAPGLAAGAVTRSPELAFAGAAIPGALSQGAGTYDVAREKGLDPLAAGQASSFDALAEGTLGTLGIKPLFKAGSPLFKRVVDSLYQELPAELATTALQDMNAKVSYNPQMTAEEFANDLAMTVVQVAAQVPASAGLVRATEVVSEKGQRAYYGYRAKQLLSSGAFPQDPRQGFLQKVDAEGNFRVWGGEQAPVEEGDASPVKRLSPNYYDASEAKLIDLEDATQARPLLYRVLADKTASPATHAWAREQLTDTDLTFANDIEHEALKSAAKSLGFDGIRSNDGASVWNQSALKKISAAEHAARAFEFQNAADIGGPYTYLPQAFTRLQELHSTSVSVLNESLEAATPGLPKIPVPGGVIDPQTGLPAEVATVPADSSQTLAEPEPLGDSIRADEFGAVLAPKATSYYNATNPDQVSTHPFDAFGGASEFRAQVARGDVLVVGEPGSFREHAANKAAQGKTLEETNAVLQQLQAELGRYGRYFQETYLRRNGQKPPVVFVWASDDNHLMRDLGAFSRSSDDAVVITLSDKAHMDLQLANQTSTADFAKSLARDAMTTVHHELGHAYLDQMVRTAPPKIVEGLRREYLRWLQKITQPGYTLRQYMQDIGSPSHFTAYERSLSGLLDKPFVELYADRLSKLGAPAADYLVNFHEWAARQMERYAVKGNKSKSAQSDFWRQTASELQTFAKKIGVKLAPNDVFSAFANYNRSLNALQDLAASYKAAPPMIRSAPVDFGTRMVKTLTGKEIKFTKEMARRSQEGIDTYNKLHRHLATLTQLVKANPHIESLQQYIQGVRDFHTTATSWMTRANDRLIQWERIGKDQSDRLAKFLYDWTLLESRPPVQELQALADKHGLDAPALEVFKAVDGDFHAMLSDMEQTLKADVTATIKDPKAQEMAIRAIEADFAVLYAKPYFPLKRFGRYTIQLRAQKKTSFEGKDYRTGSIIRFETYESEAERNEAYDDLLKRFPEKGLTMSLSKGLVEENFQYFAGLPPMLVKNLASKLQLTEEQSKSLQHLLHDLAPAQSFVKHFNKRKETAGFSENAIRTYASYFFQASRHLARVKHHLSLQASMKALRDSAVDLDKTHGADSTKRHLIHEHVQRHYDYIMNPQNEWAALRGFGFLWYLGFNVKSAVINLTQVPMVAYPYLAARYGDASASIALSKSIKDETSYWRNPGKQPPEEALAFEEMRKAGFITESQATELAGFSEGARLVRALPATQASILPRSLAYYGAWMFQQTEQFNRRIVARAAYRMARESGLSPQGAFEAARDAVESSMFEYASWNRAEFMRGKKSVIFLFFQYVQNMSYFMFGGDKGWWRTVALMFFMAGLEGLPYVDNFLDLANGLWKRVPGKKDHILLEDYAREFAVNLQVNPDLLMHGMGRNSFGIGWLMEMLNYDAPSFDVSASLGMGRVVPGTETLGAVMGGNVKYQEALAKATEDVGGAFVAIPLAFLKATTDDNPDHYKRWERVLPTAAKNASRAWEAASRGANLDAQQVPLRRYDPFDPKDVAEIAGMALGFQNTEVAQEWERRGATREVTQYWMIRRQMLLQNYHYAWGMKDREAKADAMAAVREYNREVPYNELKLSFDTLAKSILAREKSKQLAEKQLPRSQNLRRTSAAEGELYPVGPTGPEGG